MFINHSAATIMGGAGCVEHHPYMQLDLGQRRLADALAP